MYHGYTVETYFPFIVSENPKTESVTKLFSRKAREVHVIIIQLMHTSFFIDIIGHCKPSVSITDLVSHTT